MPKPEPIVTGITVEMGNLRAIVGRGVVTLEKVGPRRGVQQHMVLEPAELAAVIEMLSLAQRHAGPTRLGLPSGAAAVPPKAASDA